jgi:hypothetical protein
MVNIIESCPNLGICLNEIITRPESISNGLSHRRWIICTNTHRNQEVDV